MERLVRRLAWPVAIISLTLTAAGLILLLLTFDRPSVALWGFRGFEAIFAFETILLGALMMSRRPENVIGPLFGIVGLTDSTQLFMAQYLVAGANGALPLTGWAAVVYAPIWVPSVAITVGYVPLVFPDGHLLSPRWRWAVAALTVGLVGTMILPLLSPNVGGGGSTVPFPYAPIADAQALAVPWSLSYAAIGIGVIAAFGSLWLRWRRSTGVEREQLKWLAWAGGLVVVMIPITFLPFKVVQVIFILVLALVPLAIGIAVLRYRLYEIDAVISRTLVYGALTAILAGLFAGVQRLLQGVFVAATGNESDAALVITTLVLATAFAPLKAWLERLVAHRFKEPPAGPALALVPVLGEPADGPTPAIAPDELESMLRRVVRDELATAMAQFEASRSERGS